MVKDLEMNQNRTIKYTKDLKLEKNLKILNNILAGVEPQSSTTLKYPIIFIIGVPRSGTTLLFQWLSKTNIFVYPTNIIARFYKAPYIGSLIQKVLVDEQIIPKNTINFESDLGKTQGALSPSEYWYFWRQYFHFGEIQRLNKRSINSVNKKEFISKISNLEAVFNKPVLMKALILSWHLPFLYSLFPNSLFLHIRRDEVFNAQSLLIARNKFFGSYQSWFSYKPPEYWSLKNLSPCKQVAGQVFYTNKAIMAGLKTIRSQNKLTIEYQEICDNPEKIFAEIAKKLNKLGFEVSGKYMGEKKFKSQNIYKLNQSKINKIESYFDFLQENAT